MPHTLAALLPVCLVILLGFGLQRSHALGEEVWSGLEQACYYVLFPALIVHTVADADFTRIAVLGLLGGFFSALALAAGSLIAAKPLLSRAFGLGDAGFTSLFQACTRWHGFMALAIVNALYGATAIPVVAVALAALVPALNVVNVSILLVWGEGPEAAPRAILPELARNPFILACGLGALLNATGLGLPEPLHGACRTLGDGALGASLLSIGAGLRPLKSNGEWGAMAFGAGFRLLLMPAVLFAILTWLGVGGLDRTVGVLCGSVPTAASAYVLARRMGGDAPLMAGMITFQVLAAAVTLPLVIALLELAGPGP